MANVKAKYVRIQSTIDIKVTAGLQYANYTNPDAHIPDRMKVGSLWNKLTCLIKKGVGVYPAEILEWNTVKSLNKEKIITIGEMLDSPDNQVTENMKTELELNLKEVKEKSTSKVALPNI